MIAWYVHTVYIKEHGMRNPSMRHKHLTLDQKKIDFAKRYFGVNSEQEAIDRALSLLVEEREILAAMKPLRGTLKGDRRPWPYR
jgi:hypothetical protein